MSKNTAAAPPENPAGGRPTPVTLSQQSSFVKYYMLVNKLWPDRSTTKPLPFLEREIQGQFPPSTTCNRRARLDTAPSRLVLVTSQEYSTRDWQGDAANRQV